MTTGETPDLDEDGDDGVRRARRVKRAWCALFRPRLERCQRTSRLDFGFFPGAADAEAAGRTRRAGARFVARGREGHAGWRIRRKDKMVELAACETRLRARARCASVNAYKDAKLRPGGGADGAGQRREPRVGIAPGDSPG
jgi:hypothetical protein